MLTSDLIKPFVRQMGASVNIDLLDETDAKSLRSAQELIDLFGQMVGCPRLVWWQAREALEGTRIDYLRLRGLAKVLEDEATFRPLEAAFIPYEVRRTL